MEQKDEVLARAKELIKDEISELRFNSWIRSIEILSIDGESVCLGVNNPYQKGRLEGEFADLIREAFKLVLNREELLVNIIDMSAKDIKTQPSQVQTSVLRNTLCSRRYIKSKIYI